MAAPRLRAADNAGGPRGPTAPPWRAQTGPPPLSARPQAWSSSARSHTAVAAPAVVAAPRRLWTRRGRSQNPKARTSRSPPRDSLRGAPPGRGERAGQPSPAPPRPSPPPRPQPDRPDQAPGVSCCTSAHFPPPPLLPDYPATLHPLLSRYSGSRLRRSRITLRASSRAPPPAGSSLPAALGAQSWWPEPAPSRVRAWLISGCAQAERDPPKAAAARGQAQALALSEVGSGVQSLPAEQRI